MTNDEELLRWADKAIKRTKEELDKKHFHASIEVIDYLRHNGVNENILLFVKNRLIFCY